MGKEKGVTPSISFYRSAYAVSLSPKDKVTLELVFKLSLKPIADKFETELEDQTLPVLNGIKLISALDFVTGLLIQIKPVF